MAKTLSMSRMSPAELASGKMPAAQMPGCYYITEKDIHSLHCIKVQRYHNLINSYLYLLFLTSLIVLKGLTLNQKVHIFALPI